jgi:hypothetical protein
MNASTITRFPGLKSLKKVATAVAAIAAISISTGALAPAPASAATGVAGCFNYNGVAYTNVVTQLESYTSSGWQALPETVSHTDSNGCYSYWVSGGWAQLNLRVVAAAWAPALRGFLWGYSPSYATPGTGSVNVGNGSLGYIPAGSLPAPKKKLTSSWLDEMVAARTCDGTGSSAMQVACYMDEHGMVGNVIVQYVDSDGDGYLDTQDKYDHNSSRH